MVTAGTKVDPVTFEVLRHRLWMINDEQGRIATQISGSPVVYEAYDFNSSLLTPEGDSIFVGIYTTRLSLSLHIAAKWIIKHLADNPGFAEGDAFITNDPWAGASHMNDFLMVAPIFWEGQMVAWTGIAMHEVDVGGPNPGSFTVGAKDVFGEGPIITPIKLVERGVVRKDIEAAVVRNSRTPELNALDLRARLAAINRTRESIHDIVARYGKDTFLAVQAQIIEFSRRAFARRLSELPDGEWREQGLMDHDGNENRLYDFKLAMRKQGDRLVFDYTGTSPQAPGMINCTRVGLEGGTMSAILPTLCYDMPWCPAGIMQQLDIISEEGTINNARHPAAVSMATVAAAYFTGMVACNTIAKMLAASERYQDEPQANWGTPCFSTLSGRRENGQPFTGMLLDKGGGGGSRTYKDGLDAGGTYGSPASSIANVETNERIYPILYVYRKFGQDTGGPGKYRGGTGTEVMIVPHRTKDPIDMTVLGYGSTHPDPRGLYGGMPGSVNVQLLLKDADVRQQFRQGHVPRDLEETGFTRAHSTASKELVRIDVGDAILLGASGGGGFGDPLDRDPYSVERDVATRLVSAAAAGDIFGVAFDGEGRVVLPDTEMNRTALRRVRLGGKPLSPGTASGVSTEREPFLIGGCLEVVEAGGHAFVHCARCGYRYSKATVDPKSAATVREVPMVSLSPWNRYGLHEEIAVWEFCCPGCALLINVQVGRRSDGPFFDLVINE